MKRLTPRGGIERKILRSILLMGILPVSLVLAAGYVAVRRWQADLSGQTLLSMADTTATGIQLASITCLDQVARMAALPEVVSLLDGGTPPDEETKRLLGDRLAVAVSAATPGGFRPATLIDTSGMVLWSSTDPPYIPLNSKPPGAGVETVVTGLVFDGPSARYQADVVAPVNDPVTGRLLGTLYRRMDVHRMVLAALGDNLGAKSPPFEATEVFQFAHLDRSLMVASLARDTAGVAGIRLLPGDTGLEEMLRKTGRSARVLPVHGHDIAGASTDVLLVIRPLFGGETDYLLIARPLGAVYGPINTWSALALAVCILAILALWVNAYRNVHNNIVRNVLLLNEGAQIIGEGDLDLKLKIATGDELEELATSFNHMALALKNNIRRLEESEEKFRHLVNAMRDGVVQTDHRGIVGLVNPAGAEILGYENPKEVTGKTFREVFREAADLRGILRGLRERGYVERERVWAVRHDGVRTCLEISGALVRDDAGTVIGAEGIFRDLTKSVQLERESTDRAGQISAINQIANAINSSLEAGRLYESLVEELRRLADFDFASIALLNETGDTFSMRVLWPAQEPAGETTCPAGDERWCAPRVARVRACIVSHNLEGEEASRPLDFPPDIRSGMSVPLFARDLIIGALNLGSVQQRGFQRHETEVVEQVAPHVAVAIRNARLLENLKTSLEQVSRARQELHDANEELKTLDEMKTNLLSNVSHELRTPLVAVMGYTDMIYNAKVGPVNDTQKDYLGIILRNVDKLVTLIENLLDFSRIHRGAETLVFDTLNIADCARTSMEVVRPVAESREIALELSAPDEPTLVEGDKGKLGQVFTNLLSNAVKFNHHGGTVRVDISATEDSVVAKVSDTGIGIPPEALDKIFTRFYQYDSSSTRKYGGTGIGLSIAQDIVRLHGARLTAESEEGKGTTFTFALPRKGARRRQGEQTVVSRAAETRLLLEIVTQDRSLVTQIRMYLEAEGMDIVVAGTAQAALALLERHRPDCVLVDIEDGRVSDTIFAEMITPLASAEVPVILHTGPETDAAAGLAPAAAQIKPGFRKSTLLSAIHYAIGQGEASDSTLGAGILCVDDDCEIATFIKRCLETEGFAVDHCTSGEEALRQVAGREYRLVLLDIAMPGMDGWEVCRRIKEDPRLAGVKVCLVTAKPIEAGDPRITRARADGFLPKPFKPEDLVELVRGYDVAPKNPQTENGLK
jgi:PAS domain S-box-containing protein